MCSHSAAASTRHSCVNLAILFTGAFLAAFHLLLISGCAARATHPPPSATYPALKLAAPFTDHMVLQRDRAVPVWGWAAPREAILIEIQGKTSSALADSAGAWKTELPPLEAGGPYQLAVRADGRRLVLTDVLVGEVWLCSGQSNMEMMLDGWGKVNDYEKEIAAATHSYIRMLTIPHTVAMTPQTDVKTNGWKPCTPDTAAAFSAVAYFFARDLRQRLGVPVGLIQSAWGGTPIKVWASLDALQTESSMKPELDSLKPETIRDVDQARAFYQKQFRLWTAALTSKDAGGPTDRGAAWAAAAFDDSQWPTLDVPGIWENPELKNFDGVVWFRREVDIPADWAGKPLRLDLGPVDDEDWTYFNGTQVGVTNTFGIFRKYEIPADLVKPGRAVITVRVLDNIGGGGVFGKPEECVLRLGADESGPTLPLAGSWRYHVGLDIRSLPTLPPDPGSMFPRWPACLFNGMIAPLVPYAIAGTIWYHGESDAHQAYNYRSLFPAMIRDWRARWGQGEFPFLFVQLANFTDPPKEPGDSNWAELREAQSMTLSLPNTGMAVAIDIGDAKDIHPKNKQDVGRRLALAARALVYGEKIEYSGPVYRPGSLTSEGNALRVGFDHTAGGLMTKGDSDSPVGFSIAGEDRKFVWADARIDGDTVVVSSPRVPRPVAVRYAWADNPPTNFYNALGLPACPFRTDDWPGATQPK